MIVHRKLQDIIESKLYKGKAIVLIGARQVGKSTLYRQIVEKKTRKGIVFEL